jgi:hypothetical protein
LHVVTLLLGPVLTALDCSTAQCAFPPPWFKIKVAAQFISVFFWDLQNFWIFGGYGESAPNASSDPAIKTIPLSVCQLCHCVALLPQKLLNPRGLTFCSTLSQEVIHYSFTKPQDCLVFCCILCLLHPGLFVPIWEPGHSSLNSYLYPSFQPRKIHCSLLTD